MSYMFYNCGKLYNLDLYSFNTKNVINMSKMFYNCKNLNNLDLSSFDTKNVTAANGIFYGCGKIVIEHNLYKFKQFNLDYLTKDENKIIFKSYTNKI